MAKVLEMRKTISVIIAVFLWSTAGTLTACDEDSEQTDQIDEADQAGDDTDAELESVSNAAAQYVRLDLALSNEWDAAHCECHPQDRLEQMGHDDAEDCLEAAAIDEATIDEIGNCIEESILQIDEPASPAVSEYFECAVDQLDVELNCISNARQHTDDLCDEELEDFMETCATDYTCDDHLDDEAQRWLDRRVDLDDCFEPIE